MATLSRQHLQVCCHVCACLLSVQECDRAALCTARFVNPVAPSWGVTVSDTRIGNHIMDSIESSKASGVVVVDMREFRSRLPCLLYQVRRA